MSLETLIEENRGAIEAETASAKAVFSVEGGLVGLTALPGAGPVRQTQRRCSAGSRARCDRPMGSREHEPRIVLARMIECLIISLAL
jgi:hypothetical protein